MRAEGFPPVFDGNSKLLILGSFPSVKSRAEGFYYGNPQNRFWRTVCNYFGETLPASVPEKRALVLRCRLALWDVVTGCDIVGSADAAIRNETVADVPALLAESAVERIFCNGTKSFALLKEHFPQLLPVTALLPSTSPANPRFSEQTWFDALDGVFGVRRMSGCAWDETHIRREK